MNWDRVEGNWKEFKGKVQQQWGKLTNDDLDVIEGHRQELAGRKGLHEVIVGTAVQSLEACLLAGVRGQEDYRNIAHV